MGSMPACDPRGPSVNPALGKLVKQIFLSVSCIVDFLAKQSVLHIHVLFIGHV